MEDVKYLDQPHSVKFSINAKKKYSAEIKCYGKTPEEALENTARISKSVERIIDEKNNGGN
jgi:hypothetical protein